MQINVIYFLLIHTIVVGFKIHVLLLLFTQTHMSSPNNICGTKVPGNIKYLLKIIRTYSEGTKNSTNASYNFVLRKAGDTGHN